MCLQSSTVQIHNQNILDVAKNVMKVPGWKCEWGSTLTSGSECRVVLHLLLHCKHGKLNDKKKYPCHLPRCNVPQDIAFFDSYEDLTKHIESSHMNRVPIVCPISECHAPTFSRPGALEAHVAEIHKEIFGLPFTSPLLLPPWTPSFIQQNPQLPDLSTRVFPSEILTGPCKGHWKISNDLCQAQVINTQFPLASPRKYQKPGPFSGGGGKGPAVPDMIFADLVRESDKYGMWIGDLHANYLIQGMGTCVDLSRPQSMFPPEACIHKFPPKSIHYKVFEERLETLEREGKNDHLVAM